MSLIEIRPFKASDRDAVTAVILPIQQQEFGIPITAADQPDLAAIETFYQSGRGQFWVAVKDGRVVGTLGLKDIGNGQAALRKMFVSAEARGRQDGIAAKLLDALTTHARQAGIRQVLLGTTDRFLAAHRFYEKNGFGEISADDLPSSFPRMAVDSKFYSLTLAA